MLKFENKSNGRYYYLVINKDMLSEHTLTIIRGGRNANRVLHRGFSNRYDLMAEVSRISKMRIKRGYTLVN